MSKQNTMLTLWQSWTTTAGFIRTNMCMTCSMSITGWLCWPAKSPDFNLIENLWEFLGQQGLFFFPCLLVGIVVATGWKGQPRLLYRQSQIAAPPGRSQDCPKPTVRSNHFSRSPKCAHSQWAKIDKMTLVEKDCYCFKVMVNKGEILLS